MSRPTLRFALMASALLLARLCAAMPDKIPPRDVGMREYHDNCALCHGERGRGDGPGIEFLKRTPSDLGVLTRNNGGVFPYDRVYRIIDGRQMLPGHGSRDMPVWGRQFSQQTEKADEYYAGVPYTMEMYVRSRIMALIDYLNRLQVR